MGHLGLGKLASSFLTPELESTPINSNGVSIILVSSRGGGRAAPAEILLHPGEAGRQMAPPGDRGDIWAQLYLLNASPCHDCCVNASLYPKPVPSWHSPLLHSQAGKCQLVCNDRFAGKEKSEKEPINYLLCHQSRHIILLGHVSLIWANLSPTSLCLKLVV